RRPSGRRPKALQPKSGQLFKKDSPAQPGGLGEAGAVIAFCCTGLACPVVSERRQAQVNSDRRANPGKNVTPCELWMSGFDKKELCVSLKEAGAEITEGPVSLS